MLFEHADIKAEKRGALGLITLTRIKALNALNDAMIDGMQRALDTFAADTAITQVAICSASPKAFCAGGDIRLMHDLGKAGQHAQALDFWAREYRVNALIHRYAKPYIAFLDGIVMGGGVGLSQHGRYRLAGPNYLFAMPEVGIGFFPDVGASYALARLPDHAGLWLALTGARIRRADALALGLATHAIPAESEADILSRLALGEAIDNVLVDFTDPPGPSAYLDQRAKIAHYFSQPGLAAIDHTLQAAAASDPFAAEYAAATPKRSPTSMAIAYEQVRRGAGLDFDAAMRMEFRIVSRIIRDADFYEGVRAVIIDKDQNPRWQPATLADLSPAAIEAHFAPLPAELTFAWDQPR